MTDQENIERPGQCVLCSLTVAKHAGPYDHDPNERHRPPRTTGRVCLHILIGLGLGLRLGDAFTNAQAGYRPTWAGIVITMTM